ncbi:MAG: exodeoxyribonuclease VII large subunit [Clostridiales bacterium]|nr:exodeoxyribonuclease VII large subunit [Clostridiales bacterium]
MSEPYISISQINTYIRNIFEAEVMLQNICVYGEVSSYSVSGGNAYFNLKDESGMLACVLFGAGRFDAPKIGDMVLVRGSMSYYAKGGKLSFNAISIMPYGKGLLYEKFLALKAELESRGYFDPARKRTLPGRVKRIGVVSSETGAVIRDIIDVTHRRNDGIDIVLFPVKVQGLGADHEIAMGIDFFSCYDDVDVVIVARGGGSMEDLEPFNSEIVATATYNCTKPVVSAVGHETDFTIIDFVADLRAPTPSAAAELVAWDKTLEIEKVNSVIRSMNRSIDALIHDVSSTIIDNMDGCSSNIDNLIARYNLRLDMSVSNLSLIDRLVDNYGHKLDKSIILLDSLNPRKVTSLGYSKVLKGGKNIASIKDIKVGDKINISMMDGQIVSSVEEVV